MVRYEIQGNQDNAIKYLSYAKNQLRLLKKLKVPLGIYHCTRILPDAEIFIKSIGYTDLIRINGLGGHVNALYLVTIGFPVSSTELGTVLYSSNDSDGLPLAKAYTYSIKDNALIKTGKKLELSGNSFELGALGGLNLTMQEGRDEHYDMLSHAYTHEEEVGLLDWKTFQQWDGDIINNWNGGPPDVNLGWGEGFVRYGKSCILGSNKVIQNPDPKSSLSATGGSSRKDYVLNAAGEITHIGLAIQGVIDDRQYVPTDWFGYGIAFFRKIKEKLYDYRYVKTYYVNSTTVGGVHQSVEIARDLHNGTDEFIDWQEYDDWTYFVPILAITNTKALMRKAQREGSGKTCWDGEITEKLMIGDEVLDTIVFEEHGDLTETAIAPSVANPPMEQTGDGTYGYWVHGCQSSDEHWEVEGIGASFPDPTVGVLELEGACGEIEITGTCVSCDLSATLTDYAGCCPTPFIVSGPDTVLKNDVITYETSPTGLVASWSITVESGTVSGKAKGALGGTTINLETGELTVGANACGTLKIIADFCGDTVHKYVRVADGGTWMNVELLSCQAQSSNGAACPIAYVSSIEIVGNYRLYCYESISGKKLFWNADHTTPTKNSICYKAQDTYGFSTLLYGEARTSKAEVSCSCALDTCAVHLGSFEAWYGQVQTWTCV